MKEANLIRMWCAALERNYPKAVYTRVENSVAVGMPDLYVWNPEANMSYWVEFKSKSSASRDGWLFRKSQWSWIVRHVDCTSTPIRYVAEKNGVIYTNRFDSIFSRIKVVPVAREGYVRLNLLELSHKIEL